MNLGADVRRAHDVAHLRIHPIHAHVFVGNVDQPGLRAEAARLPVFRARGRRTDVAGDRTDLGFLLRIDDQAAGLQVHALGGVHRAERIGGQHSAGLAIDHIDVAIAIEVNQDLLHLPAERHVEQDLLVDTVVVVLIVRGKLVIPVRLARGRIPREDARRPLVIARPLVRIPRSGISGSMYERVELGIVGDPAPDIAATDLPGVLRPTLHPQVGSLVSRVERLEAAPDEHLFVGTGVVCLPLQFASVLVQCDDPAAHTEFAT